MKFDINVWGWPPPTVQETMRRNSGTCPFALGREVRILTGRDAGKYGVIDDHGDPCECKVNVIENNRLHHFDWFSVAELEPTL